MPKYKVTVSYTTLHSKIMDIYAKDEEAAEEKATEIIRDWDNVAEVSVDEVEQVR